MGLLFAFIFIALMAAGIVVAIFGFKGHKGNRRIGVGFAGAAMSAVMLVLLIFVPAGFVTVNTGEIAVVKVWGAAKEVKTAGLYFRNIISTDYEIYDIKTQQIDSEVYAYSLDGQTLKVNITTQLSIRSDKAVEIATTYGNLEVLKSRIAKIAEEKVKVVLAGKSAMDIIATRQSLSPTVLVELRTLEEQYYMTIDNFVVVDLEFNEAFENAVEQKMIAEQDKLKAEYDKAKAIIKAEELLEIAKLNAEALLATAEGEAKSEIERAKAQAEALAVISEVWANIPAEIRATMLQEQFYAKWDGKLPDVMSDDISILFPAP